MVNDIKIKFLYNRIKARRIKALIEPISKIPIATKMLGLIPQPNVLSFKEPVMFLIRTNKKVEFYQNVMDETFMITNSNGMEIKPNLDSKFLLDFDMGTKTFTGFIQYENEMLPYPTDPIIYAEQFRSIVIKIINDIRNHKAESINARGEMIQKILIGIAIVIAVIFVGYTLAPDLINSLLSGKVPGTKEATKTIIENVSILK